MIEYISDCLLQVPCVFKQPREFVRVCCLWELRNLASFFLRVYEVDAYKHCSSRHKLMSLGLDHPSALYCDSSKLPAEKELRKHESKLESKLECKLL